MSENIKKYYLHNDKNNSAEIQKQLFWEGIWWRSSPRTKPKHTNEPFFVVTVTSSGEKFLSFSSIPIGECCENVEDLIYQVSKIKQKDDLMNIGGHEIKDVTRNSAKVGCTTVTRDQVQGLLDHMNDVPEQEFPVMPLGEYSYTAAIEACRDRFWSDSLMGVRAAGNYKGKGLVLKSGWKIVIDNQGYQVLVREKDAQ